MRLILAGGDWSGATSRIASRATIGTGGHASAVAWLEIRAKRKLWTA